jgi:hypothetical protein
MMPFPRLACDRTVIVATPEASVVPSLTMLKGPQQSTLPSTKKPGIGVAPPSVMVAVTD